MEAEMPVWQPLGLWLTSRRDGEHLSWWQGSRCKGSSALSLSLSVSLPPHPCSRCWVYCWTEKHTLFVRLNNNKIGFLDWSHVGWLLRIHTITCFWFGHLLSFIFCRWCMTLLVVLREKHINSGEEWGEIPEQPLFSLFFLLFIYFGFLLSPLQCYGCHLRYSTHDIYPKEGHWQMFQTSLWPGQQMPPRHIR